MFELLLLTVSICSNKTGFLGHMKRNNKYINTYPKNECAFSHTENVIHNKHQPSASLRSEITAQAKATRRTSKKCFEIILSPYQYTGGEYSDCCSSFFVL